MARQHPQTSRPGALLQQQFQAAKQPSEEGATAVAEREEAVTPEAEDTPVVPEVEKEPGQLEPWQRPHLPPKRHIPEKAPQVGQQVNYWQELSLKKPCVAFITEVRADGIVNLGTFTAQGMPRGRIGIAYSPVPRINHWTYREE